MVQEGENDDFAILTEELNEDAFIISLDMYKTYHKKDIVSVEWLGLPWHIESPSCPLENSQRWKSDLPLLSQGMSEENARKICLEKGYIQEYEAGKIFLETRKREQIAKIHSLEISRAQLEKKLDMKEPIANSVSAIHRVKFAVSFAFYTQLFTFCFDFSLTIPKEKKERVHGKHACPLQLLKLKWKISSLKTWTSELDM